MKFEVYVTNDLQDNEQKRRMTADKQTDGRMGQNHYVSPMKEIFNYPNLHVLSYNKSPLSIIVLILCTETLIQQSNNLL